MSHKTLSITIPIGIYDLLKTEADEDIRSLNQQINVILRDRYHTHAPPTPKRSASKPQNGQNSRKSKATIS
jgi:hypothetical protein